MLAHWCGEVKWSSTVDIIIRTIITSFSFLKKNLSDLNAQGHKRGWIVSTDFSIVSEHSWELFEMGVWSDTEQ